MVTWKCSSCAYTLEADKPPDECPACRKICEFVDISCYTPDCIAGGIDERIGSK
ncbi:MAG: hypothetical protein Q8P24_15280 [Desulfobacterales bacterium]|nr:hypothetical protein [Desulfobacterales bacterium]